MKEKFLFILLLQSMLFATTTNYVCYTKKRVENNHYRYAGCSLRKNTCSNFNKKHFGKYPTFKLAMEALERCENSQPKFVNSGKNISKPTKNDLIIKDNGIKLFNSIEANIISFGGDATPECKLAISLDGKYFYLTKLQSTCKKIVNRYNKKIICNSNKSVCKTRDELRDFVMSSSNNNSNYINTNKPSWCKYAKSYVENKICTDRQLSNLDEKLVDAFNKALIKVNNTNKLEELEKKWVKKRDADCNGRGISCIKNKYIQRIRYLNNLSKKSTSSTNMNSSTKVNHKKTKAKKSTGTGFFINSKNILTNYHVVKQCSKIIVKNSDLDSFSAVVKVFDKSNDLAVLKINQAFDIHLNFRQNRLEIGEDIITLGYPLGSYLGDNVKLTMGNISSLNGVLNDTTKLQFTAPIQHGNSGGSLLDNSGNVVGIIYAGLKSNVAQNVNLAIKNSVAKMLLDAYGIKYYESDSNKQLKASDVVRKTQKSIVKVICK